MDNVQWIIDNDLSAEETHNLTANCRSYPRPNGKHSHSIRTGTNIAQLSIINFQLSIRFRIYPEN